MIIDIEIENKIIRIRATEMGFSYENYQSYTIPGLLS
jgi:hypothetical protein